MKSMCPLFCTYLSILRERRLCPIPTTAADNPIRLWSREFIPYTIASWHGTILHVPSRPSYFFSHASQSQAIVRPLPPLSSYVHRLVQHSLLPTAQNVEAPPNPSHPQPRFPNSLILHYLPPDQPMTSGSMPSITPFSKFETKFP